jgi:hypothetical protein
MIRRRPLQVLSILTLAIAASTLGACVLPLRAEARDEWKRSYPLAQGGSLEILNTNGEIRVEPADGSTIEVVATRVAKAATDDDAKTALKRIEISENVTPNRVLLDSSRGGIAFEMGVSRRVDYLVRVPRWANVTLKSTNGEIVASGIVGKVRLDTTNGEIRATAIEGALHAESTNGDMELELVKVSEDGVDCSTTNGEIILTVPAAAKASLSAETNNGDIETRGLELSVQEKGRKDLRATLGGGGARIKLSTTNGDITVKGR